MIGNYSSASPLAIRVSRSASTSMCSIASRAMQAMKTGINATKPPAQPVPSAEWPLLDRYWLKALSRRSFPGYARSRFKVIPVPGPLASPCSMSVTATSALPEAPQNGGSHRERLGQ